MKQFEFSSELRDKVTESSNLEEILALASDQGVELTDEELEQVSGGGWTGDDDPVASNCPFCGSSDTEALWSSGNDHGCWYGHCNSCGKSWFPPA